MSNVSEEGRKLFAFLTAARQFNHDLSALLLTADSLMAAEGWSSASNYCNEGVSANLHIPSGWFPKDLLRFYRNVEARPNVLAVVSVTLIRRSEPAVIRPLDEPLISVNWFDYASESSDEHSSSINWYGWWHMYFPAAPYGEWVRRAVADLPLADREQNKYRFTTAWSMSQALVDVTSADGLKELVVRPLLQSVAANAIPFSTKKS